MLGQRESGGLLAREPDGRRYTPAPRLLRLAESTLSAGTQHGVRHAVLRQLVADIGESCNLTALSGAEVILKPAVTPSPAALPEGLADQ